MFKNLRYQFNKFLSNLRNPRNYRIYMAIGLIILLFIMFYFFVFQTYRQTDNDIVPNLYPKVLKQEGSLVLLEDENGNWKIESLDNSISEQQARQIFDVPEDKEVIFDIPGAAGSREFITDETEDLTQQDYERFGLSENHSE